MTKSRNPKESIMAKATKLAVTVIWIVSKTRTFWTNFFLISRSLKLVYRPFDLLDYMSVFALAWSCELEFASWGSSSSFTIGRAVSVFKFIYWSNFRSSLFSFFKFTGFKWDICFPLLEYLFWFSSGDSTSCLIWSLLISMLSNAIFTMGSSKILFPTYFYFSCSML